MPLFIRILSAEGQPITGLSGPVTVKGYEGWIEARELTFRLSRGGNARVLEEDEVQEQAEEMEKLADELTGQQRANSTEVVKSRFGGGTPTGTKSDVKKIAKAGSARWQSVARSTGNLTSRDDAVGPPVFEAVRLVKLFDRSSAGIFRWSAREAVNDEAVIASRRRIEAHIVRRKSGTDDLAPSILMTFDECLPSSYDCDFSDGSELPEETIEFRIAKVRFEFREFGADGTETSGGKRTTEFSQKDVGT